MDEPNERFHITQAELDEIAGAVKVLDEFTYRLLDDRRKASGTLLIGPGSLTSDELCPVFNEWYEVRCRLEEALVGEYQLVVELGSWAEVGEYVQDMATRTDETG